MRRELIGETLLNQFRIENYIASGGMATIYRVWDLQRSVPLAMKVLHPELAADPAFIARFRREAQSLQMLVHPHIVPFYGLYQDGELTFLLERYIDGPSLDEVLRTRGGRAMPTLDVLVIVKALYTSLGYAHAQGIIHCDIKPGNVLIDQGGHVYLTDFGIARYIDSSVTTSSALGTPLYMAPEQIRNERLTPQTDVYSLGVLLYELLTGRRAFTGEGEIPAGAGNNPSDRIRYQHLYQAPPHPRAVNGEIPEALAQVVLRAMEKDPGQRYPTMQAMAEAIERAVGARFDGLPNRMRMGEDSAAGSPAAGSPAAGEISGAEPAVSGPAVEAGAGWGDTLPGRPPVSPPISPPGRMVSGRRGISRRVAVALGAVLILTLCVALGIQAWRGLFAAGGGSTATVPASTAGPDPVETETVPAESPTVTPTEGDLSGFAVEGEIAIVQRDARDRLYLVNAGDGGQEALPESEEADLRLSQAPQWSADGQYLTWMSQYDGRLHIMAMQMETREPYVISAGEDYPRVSSPAWMGDGERIAFWAADGSRNLLVIANGESGEELEQVSLPGYRNLFVWSGADGPVAFAQQVNGLYEVVTSAAANGADYVIDSGGEEYAPAWSHDGAWLAFQSDAGRNPGENEIWVARANGAEMRRVTSSPEGSWSRAPTWSPDGRMIAFVSNRAGSIGADYGELFVVDVQSGTVTQITNSGGRVYDWRPAWRP